ncbi:MAG: serine/threonine-protein kinase, partial [Cyanobacteria bacterium]|nr:serine/threonine-protein kinase [Cyanobacteriota bacterium]
MSTPLNICAACKKQIGSRRHGSLTQFIFGPEQCSCDKPVSLNMEPPSALQTNKHRAETDDDEASIEIDPATFPVDRYKPIALLGTGAAGKVYLCRDRHLANKQVAVKVLHRLTADQLIDFQEEARATSNLHHENIVSVIDFGVTQGSVPYMVMGYIPGVSLDSLLVREGSLSLEVAVAIGIQLCEALSYVHEQKILHRDIKPSNILVHESEAQLHITLIDFGVAKVKEVTGKGIRVGDQTLAGTPAYMAPDTVSGFEYDERSEVYSVGCVLFELLAGAPPLLHKSALSTLERHAREHAPSLESVAHRKFPPQLEAVVHQCLEPVPDKRIQSAGEVADRLSVFLEGYEQPSSDDDRVNEKIADRQSRPLRLVIPAALLLVSALGAMTILTFANPRLKKTSVPHTKIAVKHRTVPTATTSADSQDGDIKQLILATTKRNRHKTPSRKTNQQKIESLKTSISELEKGNGSMSPRLIAPLLELASAYRSEAMYVQSVDQHVRANKIMIDSGHQDDQLAGSYGDLGSIYLRFGKYAEAEPLFVAALQIVKQKHGASSIETIDAMRRLGGLYREMGAYKKAEAILLETQALVEKVSNPDASSLVSTVNAIGLVYYKQGRYREAESTFRRALQISSEKLGPDAEDTGTCFNNLGNLYRYVGKTTAGEAFLKKSLAVAIRNSADDEDLAAKCNNLGLLYMDAGQLNKADLLVSKAVEISSEVEGESPTTALYVSNLGGIEARKEHYHRAIELFMRSLKIRLKRLGPAHIDVADNCHQIG